MIGVAQYKVLLLLPQIHWLLVVHLSVHQQLEQPHHLAMLHLPLLLHRSSQRRLLVAITCHHLRGCGRSHPTHPLPPHRSTTGLAPLPTCRGLTEPLLS